MPVLPPHAAVALTLLVGALLAGGLAGLGRVRLAANAVAVASVLALLLLLGVGAGPVAVALGAPLVGALVLGLVALAALESLAERPRRAGPLALLAGAVGLAAVALLSEGLATVYAGATGSALLAWGAAIVDRRTGPAGARAAGHWLLALLLGDLGVLAAALGLGGEAGLVVAAVARLGLFPLQALVLATRRLTGRAEVALTVVSSAIGTDLLGRALRLRASLPEPWPWPLGPWLLGGALATALAAALLLGRGRGYRATLAWTALVDGAHVAAGVAIATPLGLAAALLHALDSALARTTLLAIADASGERGQQIRRLPDGPALVPFALGFGALTAMPPQPGFVARWLLYLALFQVGAWPVALVLALSAAVSLAAVLTQVGRLGPPAQPRLAARPLLVALAVLWVPLGLFVVAPIVVLDVLIAPLVPTIWPDQTLALGVDVLLGLPGALALLLAATVVLAGFAGYLRRVPTRLRLLARLWRSARVAPLRRLVEATARAGLPFRLLESLGVLVADGARLLLEPWEARFAAIALAAVVLLMLLVALG